MDYSQYGFALKEGQVVYKNTPDSETTLPGMKPFGIGYYVVTKIRKSIFSKSNITAKNAKDEFVYVLVKCSCAGKPFKADFPITVKYIDNLIGAGEVELKN